MHTLVEKSLSRYFQEGDLDVITIGGGSLVPIPRAS
jgi:hypothetical protein